MLISVFHSVFPLVSILENEMTIDDGYFGIHSKWNILILAAYLTWQG